MWNQVSKHWIAYVIAFILVFLTFIPYQEISFEGRYIDFDLLSKYANLAEFLSFPIGILSLILIYLTFQSQKEELSQTTKTMKQQQFETTFFNLINLKNTSLHLISERNTQTNQLLNSDVAIHYYLQKFEKFYREQKSNYLESSLIYTLSNVYNVYEKSNGIPPKLMQHFKLIDSIYITFENNGMKSMSHYNNIINSNLMKYESIFYFYYVLSSHSYYEAIMIIDKLMLTSNFTKSDLVDVSLFEYEKLLNIYNN